MLTLNEKQYPQYLKKVFKGMTGDKLNLKKPKTFNEKIQWLKLYDSTPLKTRLTDKVLARDWVRDKIGEEYLKPVLWIGKCFDEIPFDELPESFIIKCNHGCKWHFKIKNKNKLLQNKTAFGYIKSKFDSWMNTTFFPWGGFEMQYKNIVPQILIEPVLFDKECELPQEYEIYCFNGEPEIYQKIKYSVPVECSVYNKDFTQSDITFNSTYIKKNENADDNLKSTVALSKMLCSEFKLVRVDWISGNEKIYFNELTFTPYSGFFIFEDKSINEKLGNLLNLQNKEKLNVKRK